ncbi:MAG: DUF3224 domain-containing protein [Chromatiales bacterium]|nr:DUF3224 domain-containing protein [Chromatiales bacterium]
MSALAKGSFTVELKPQSKPVALDGVSLGRMTLVKQFTGDIVGTSSGQMLTALTPAKGSAGYVAMERVSGTLGGKRGSFVLQHSGTMNEGQQTLSISVVPGSGTGSLTGIEGVLKLEVVEGNHNYELEYTLPE